MSMPSAKRQRTEAASYALSKPFCSPMKTRVIGSANHGLIPTLQNSSDLVQNGNNDNIKPLELAAFHLQPAATPSYINTNRFPLSSAARPTTLNTDPEIATLLNTQQQLEKQLRDLKKELDTAEQARKIESDSIRKHADGAIDGDLRQLIMKWRTASRQAAEELFTGVRDRVNRMGGPKAWKEMQERQREFQSEWERQPLPQPDSDDEDKQDVDQRHFYTEYDIDPETVREREARGGKESHEDEGAEDEFTMAMMLSGLNVPLTTIGYDTEHQRWKD